MNEPIEYLRPESGVPKRGPTPTGSVDAGSPLPVLSPAAPAPERSGFLHTIGITPSVAALAILIDFMLSALDWLTFGAFMFFSAVAAGGVGYFSYHAQRRSGDDRHMAMAKAVILAVITLIPVPITPLVAAPAGIAGFIEKLRRH
jgi:hypothetical protein